MADVNQNDVVTVAVRAEDQGTEDVVNVYDMQMTSATGLTAGAALSDLEDWITLVYNIAKNIQSIYLLYRDFAAYNRTQGTVLGGASITVPANGAGTGSQLPSGNAMLLSFPTNVSRVVGRKYLGGIPSGLLDLDGTLNAATVTSLISIANTIRAPYTGTNGDWQYGVWRAATSQLVIPQSSVITDVVAYQRRRRAGRGS